MRPTPIADEEVWEGGRRLVVAPPSGDLTDSTIAPVEAITDTLGGPRRFCIRWIPEGDDLERLAAGEPLWLVIYGDRMPPVSLVLAEREETTDGT